MTDHRNGNGHANGQRQARGRGPGEPDVPGPPQGVRLAGHSRGREPRHLRQVLGLCRPRLGDQESRRLPHPPCRRPPGDLLPRSQGRGPRAVQRLPPSRRAGLPRARGQRAAVPVHLSRLDLQHRRLGQGYPRRRRLSAGLRQAGQEPDAGGAARALQGFLFRQSRSERASICTPISPAPRTTSISSSISRRPAAWRSSPACRNTTSRRTGNCWSRTRVDDYHLVTTHSTWLNYMRNSGVNITPTKGHMLPTKGFGLDLGNGHLTTDNPNYRGRPVARWISVYRRGGQGRHRRHPRRAGRAARRGEGGARRRHQPQPLHLPQSRHQRRLVGDGAPLHAGRARPDARHRLGARPGRGDRGAARPPPARLPDLLRPRRLRHARRRRGAGAGAAGLRRLARGAVDRPVARHGFEPGAACHRRGPSPRVLAQVERDDGGSGHEQAARSRRHRDPRRGGGLPLSRGRPARSTGGSTTGWAC